MTSTGPIPSNFAAISQAVSVVPTLAPIMIVQAARIGRAFSSAKPMVMKLTTEDDCTSAAAAAPVSAPVKRFAVARRSRPRSFSPPSVVTSRAKSRRLCR